jgi:mannosyltransferase
MSRDGATLRILYVGLRGGYKNFANGIQALGQCVTRLRNSRLLPSLALSIVSKEPLSKPEVGYLESLNICFEVYEFVSTQDLLLLYASSSLLLHTSVYEGFGITILEAMQMGCPVLAVDIPSVREVASDTIFYSSGGSVASLSNSLAPLLVDKSLLFSKVWSAKKRAQSFSWANSARTLQIFYGKIFSHKRAGLQS